MNHIHDFAHVAVTPVWRDPAEARVALRATVSNFVNTTLQSLAGQAAPPALALAVTAGLGKTQTTLDVLATWGPDLLVHGHVLFYVPTLDLAARAAEEFARLAPDVPQTVLRGRRAIDPEVGKPMCVRADLVAEISGVVRSVTESICQARRGPGEFYRSECSRDCGYMRQLRQQSHRVVFLSHAYLTARLPIQGDIACRVIDEKVWPTLTWSRRIFVEDWLKPPAPGSDEELLELHGRARMSLFTALQGGKPILTTLREDGVTAADLLALAEHEVEQMPELEIRPWQRAERQAALARAFDRHGRFNARTRADIFEHLADTIDRDTTERLRLVRIPTVDGERMAIRLYRRGDLMDGVATLFLDADADDEILRQLRPDLNVVRINAKPVAEVIQVGDLTMSSTYLLDADQGAPRRSALLDVLRREVKLAGDDGCLVVATKDVLRALHQDVGTRLAPGDDAGLMTPLLGASARWFGPRMQGVNDYKDTRTIVVIGRLQPRTDAVEDAARCLFGDGDRPLRMTEDGRLAAMPTRRLMSDDRLEPAMVQAHPDPRGMLVLSQMRECMSLQAIARLRLVAPRRPKRVVLLGNLVLPGLPVSRVVTLKALRAGLDREQDPDAYMRLARALGASNTPSVPGLRLSAAGLHADLPEAFPSVDSAQHFRRGRETGLMLQLIRRIADDRGWPVTDVGLALPRGGREIPAVIFACGHDVSSVAHRLWPQHRVAYSC